MTMTVFNLENRDRTNAAHLFKSLAKDGEVTASDIIEALGISGLDLRDERIARTVGNLKRLAPDDSLGFDRFEEVLAADEVVLISDAISGRLVIPDFAAFSRDVERLFEETRGERGGAVADYIPQLARVDPEKYALGLCTVDGQRLALGDVDDRFCVQSTCKPISYAIALERLGRSEVHRHVGREPSGRCFNELTLNDGGLPHNPMINAGAIMCSSLIDPGAPLADRFDRTIGVWEKLAGKSSIGFDNAVYLSEKETADRNFALAYFMREKGAFPPGTDIVRTLDFYFQCCSITVDVRQMSLIAATLANGGVCPTTNERIFSTETVKDCLSLMYSCGMYDFSGEYAFLVGVPAKSGVSGALMLVIPGVCGIAIWSPRLDACGNTVRGVRFSERLVANFSFHTYANMIDDPTLVDPTQSVVRRRAEEAAVICAAAAAGDVGELRRLVAAGVDVAQADYDGRTALHLAACEGQVTVARFLLEAGASAPALDRWGNTALDDALREGRDAVVELLSAAPRERDALLQAG